MAVRVTPAGNQVNGEDADASYANGVAGGWIGYIERTSDQTGITTEVAVSGVTVTVTVNASRRIEITAKAAHLATNADTVAALNIKEGSTVLDQDRATTAFANVSYNKSMTPSCVLTPSTGSHTYSLSAERITGTGTVTLVADSTRKIYLCVKDVGPAS